MSKTYSLFDSIHIHWYNEKEEQQFDSKIIQEINNSTLSDIPVASEYDNKPEDKPLPVVVKGRKVYPRNQATAKRALERADYCCEIDTSHKTFIRRVGGKNYTEPHHLVPMSAQESFDNSLDVVENIVSLCSNCHNQIHYGRDADELIEKLYKARQDQLKKKGISISIRDLLSLYGFVGIPTNKDL